LSAERSFDDVETFDDLDDVFGGPRAVRDEPEARGEPATTADTAEERVCFSLAELAEKPELLRPPEAIVPRFAWRGRVTLLAAREKAGKSTLASYILAAASRNDAGDRDLFGEPMSACEGVLWVSLEEHPGDVVRRFQAQKAAPRNVFIVTRLPEGGLAAIGQMAKDLLCSVVCIDTLAALFSGLIEDPHNSAEWTLQLQRIVRLARDTDTAWILNAHARKSDGRYRDSTAIGANVDMILEMVDESNGQSTERKIFARGRWANPTFSVRMERDGSFSLVGATDDKALELQVVDYIRLNPGCSKSAVRDGVSARAGAIDSALAALIDRDLVVNTGSERANRYKLGTGSGTAPLSGRNSLWDIAGTGSGTTPLSGNPNPIGFPGQGVPRSSDIAPGWWDAIGADQ
jgi:hypothetical protein